MCYNNAGNQDCCASGSEWLRAWLARRIKLVLLAVYLVMVGGWAPFPSVMTASRFPTIEVAPGGGANGLDDCCTGTAVPSAPRCPDGWAV